MKTAGNTVAVTDPTTANGIAKATSGSDLAPVGVGVVAELIHGAIIGLKAVRVRADAQPHDDVGCCESRTRMAR